MKFRVWIKDPDAVDYGMQDMARAEIGEQTKPGILYALADEKRESLYEFLAQWMTYGEHITIEFDTEANTAIVVPVKDGGG